MRYKIKAPDQRAYDSLKHELETHVQIKIDSPHRLMMSVDDLSDSDKQVIKNHGAKLSRAVKFEIG